MPIDDGTIFTVSDSNTVIREKYRIIDYPRDPNFSKGYYRYSTGSTNVSNSKTSAKCHNWRLKIIRHQSAVTFFDATKESYRGGYGIHYAWGYAYGSVRGFYPVSDTVTGHLVSVGKPSLPSVSADADFAAGQAFYKKAKSSMTAFRSYTALGELRETLSMIRNPGKALRRGLDDYVKAAKKRTRRAPRKRLDGIISDTWLEYTFGWAPLISDVKSAGDALNRRLERYAGNYTRISGRSTAWDATFNEPGTNIGEVYTKRRTGSRTLKRYDVRYYGEVRSVCPTPKSADARLFGTDWRELVPTAWELLPYSFLVDYFTNIGDVLDAWTVRDEDFAWVGKTIRKVAIAQTTRSVPNPTDYLGLVRDDKPHGQELVVSPARFEVKSVSRRNVDPSSILTPIRWEMPGFSTKWINMSALANGRRGYLRSAFKRG